MSSVGTKLERRALLKMALVAQGLCVISSLGCAHARAVGVAKLIARKPAGRGPLRGPFQEVAVFAGTDFQGDEMAHPHEALWDLAGYLQKMGGEAAASDRGRFDLIVVGGGLSGFLSIERSLLAWRKGLGARRTHAPLRVLLLEQASQIGGNARGEEVADDTTAKQRFALGSAYITVPEQGSSWHELLSRLDLVQELRTEDPKHIKVFDRTDSRYHDRLGARFQRALLRSHELASDAESAAAFVRRFKPSDSDLEFMQLYCWSSFGGSLEEVSAEQFVGFLIPELEHGVGAWTGGNARLVERLASYLLEQSDLELTVLNQALVLKVEDISRGAGSSVSVLWSQRSSTSQGPEIARAAASACVVSAPKYVASRIVHGVSPAQMNEWRNISYRAYIVANIRLDGSLPLPGYDLYIREGRVPDQSTFGRRTDRNLVDVVFADWAGGKQQSSTILTVYRPYPFDGARALLTSAVAFERVTREIRQEVDSLLQAMGAQHQGRPIRCLDVRLARFGHALPIARVGGLADDAVAIRSQPVGAVFFANQDDLLNPSVESAWASAERAGLAVAPQILKN